MPIRRSEFDKGEIDPSLVVLEFFRGQRDLAFPLEEVHEALAKAGINIEIEILRGMVVDLESRGRLESKVVAGRLYYRYKTFRLGR